MARIWAVLCVMAMALSSAMAKDAPFQVVTWPQTYDRNQIKRILLTPRDPVQ